MSVADLLEDWVRQRIAAGDRRLGLHGALGIGKSTVCAGLCERLGADGLRIVVLSIDDFYLTAAERRSLAETVHPLLRTRGVPGTHDVALARETMASLRGSGAVRVPRFDKRIDDRQPEPEIVMGPVDGVLVEGWCVGVGPVDPATLAESVNHLERDQDQDGRWRRHVAAQLAGPYQAWWKDLDAVAALIAPDLAAITRWRTEAEAARREDGSPAALGDVAWFVSHLERWTEWALVSMPHRADLVVRIGADRRIATGCNDS